MVIVNFIMVTDINETDIVEKEICIKTEETKIEEKETTNSQYENISNKTNLPYSVVVTIFEEANKYNINPNLLLSLIEVESNFEYLADNGIAAGLCQINYKDSTAKWLWSKIFPNETYKKDKLFDPHKNIKLGAYYISYLLKRFNNDYHKALTAYNRGPSKVVSRSKYSERVLKGMKEYK
jgi:soluble lytic murein transglycosylase-like protein